MLRWIATNAPYLSSATVVAAALGAWRRHPLAPPAWTGNEDSFDRETLLRNPWTRRLVPGYGGHQRWLAAAERLFSRGFVPLAVIAWAAWAYGMTVASLVGARAPATSWALVWTYRGAARGLLICSGALLLAPQAGAWTWMWVRSDRLFPEGLAAPDPGPALARAARVHADRALALAERLALFWWLLFVTARIEDTWLEGWHGVVGAAALFPWAVNLAAGFQLQAALGAAFGRGRKRVFALAAIIAGGMLSLGVRVTLLESIVASRPVGAQVAIYLAAGAIEALWAAARFALARRVWRRFVENAGATLLADLEASSPTRPPA